jgi:hypothetical protein
MLRVFSVAFWAFIVLTCPVFFAGALVVWLLTWPFDRRRVVLHLYSSAWAVFYLYINPLWRLRTSGRDRLPWRGAAVLLAVRHGVPVFPIAVHGTRRALPRRGLVLREHVDARVEVLPPLDPVAFGDAGALRDAARRAIAEVLGAP